MDRKQPLPVFNDVFICYTGFYWPFQFIFYVKYKVYFSALSIFMNLFGIFGFLRVYCEVLVLETVQENRELCNFKLHQGQAFQCPWSSCVLCALLLLTTHRSTKSPEATTATHTLALSQSIQSLPLYTLPGSSHFLQIFHYLLQPKRRRPAFRSAQHGWPKRTIIGNLSSFILGTCPSYLNLSLIIALKSGIEPHFHTAFCLKYGQSAGYPEQSVGNFSGKRLVNLRPLFRAPML